MLTHQFIGRRKGGFALTYSTLASIVKYPYASTHASAKKKFGFFQTEEETYCRIARELGIPGQAGASDAYVRYPLVYLVEAADDICYQIMDIEDAHKLRLLTSEEAIGLLLGFFEGRRLNDIRQTMAMVDDTNEQIAYLRSCNEERLLDGSFDAPLIDCINEQARQAYKACSEVAYRKIYVANEVVDVELAGYRIFGYLLETVIDAVLHPEHAYSQLLLRRVPGQYDIKASTTYGKIQCALDYISGMTDVYALDLYRKITGMGLPAV